MHKWVVISGFVGILALTGCGSTVSNGNQVTSYTATDVAQHASTSDCWTIIDQKVYDVTDYISRHPGGNRIAQACGVDATDFFNGTSVMGRVHSATAKALLTSFQIGTLQ